MSKDYDHKFKLVVVGDAGVGKSSLLRRFTDHTFKEGKDDVEVDFTEHTVNVFNKVVKLEIKDIKMHKLRFNTLVDFGTHGIMIVYDVTNQESFNNIQNYLMKLEVCKVLIGAKSDLLTHRVVALEKAQEFATSLNIKYIETSAKTNEKVGAAFLALVQGVFSQQIASLEKPLMTDVQLNHTEDITTISYSGKNPVILQGNSTWRIKGEDVCTVYYYEVEIKSSISGFNVGLATSTFPVSGYYLGQLPNSYGYYQDGSQIVYKDYQKTGWPKLKKGVVVGIGLVVGSQKIFGTLDGKLLGILGTTNADVLIPTIGFHKSAELQVIFAEHKHKFKIKVMDLCREPAFGSLEEMQESVQKLLVLFVKNEVPDHFSSVAEFIWSRFGYQSFYCSRRSQKETQLREMAGISPHHYGLIAFDFTKAYHHVFHQNIMNQDKDSILQAISQVIGPKSAMRPPKDRNQWCPTLVQVVQISFDELVLRGDKDVLLNVYHGELNPFRKTIEILSEIFADNENIVIAQIDSAANDLDPTYFPTKVAHTTKLFKGKKSPINCEGHWSVEEMIEQLHFNSRFKFDLESAKRQAREVADLQLLHEILERRQKYLAAVGSSEDETEVWKRIQEVDRLLLGGVSSRTQSEVQKKHLAKELLCEAYNLFYQEKHIEAKCYLNISSKLDQSTGNDKTVLELRAQISEREKLTEHELQIRIETKISEIKAEIAQAEKQAHEVKTQAERELIARQLEVLCQQEEKLQAQIAVYEARNQRWQEQEEQILQQKELISEQTAQLQQLLDELVTTATTDISQLQQTMAAVVVGDGDIDGARRKFASMQKAASAAQQALIKEEKRQRERVEWLQTQMELYRRKGMSPAQLAFRNFLKSVKRLSASRHLIEHTPHPLRCFISYAWETDDTVNKELQKRLQSLQNELETAGMEVKLDIRDMKSDMKKFMAQNINRAHKLLLICTPRLQVRAADPIKNNLQFELETALKKENLTSDFIIPLVFSGDFKDAVPPQVSNLLFINFITPTNHYHAMAALAPLGLIPMLLGLERNKDYQQIHNFLFLELEHDKQPQI